MRCVDKLQIAAIKIQFSGEYSKKRYDYWPINTLEPRPVREILMSIILPSKLPNPQLHHNTGKQCSTPSLESCSFRSPKGPPIQLDSRDIPRPGPTP